MRDGKALQMGTSHELGQRFSRAFNISYSTADGTTEHCWTTSWGASTRMLGGLIMCHGDDFGLVLPPALAPVQAVVVVVKETDGVVTRAASAVVDELNARDTNETGRQRLSRIRLACDRVGPAGRADPRGDRPARCREQRGAAIPQGYPREDHRALGQRRRRGAATDSSIQGDMLAAATARRDAFISDCATLDQAREVAQTGVARVPWASVGVAGEAISPRADSQCGACSAATGRCPKPMTTQARSPISPGPTERMGRQRAVDYHLSQRLPVQLATRQGRYLVARRHHPLGRHLVGGQLITGAGRHGAHVDSAGPGTTTAQTASPRMGVVDPDDNALRHSGEGIR